ncbi:MAG: (2Fe-2S)-binding protein [Burkholderiaceae bacterium]
MNDHPVIPIRFSLNGGQRALDIEPRELLIDVVRRQCGLTGTKRSCDVEVCGACTVLVDGLPVSSCTTLAADVDGREVTTIEGLGRDGELDPVQQAFIEHGAMQCGYCTPGMVLAIKSLLAQHRQPSEETIRHYLRGNICRCTGYTKIIEAIVDLVDRQASLRPAAATE